MRSEIGSNHIIIAVNFRLEIRLGELKVSCAANSLVVTFQFADVYFRHGSYDFITSKTLTTE